MIAKARLIFAVLILCSILSGSGCSNAVLQTEMSDEAEPAADSDVSTDSTGYFGEDLPNGSPDLPSSASTGLDQIVEETIADLRDISLEVSGEYILLLARNNTTLLGFKAIERTMDKLLDRPMKAFKAIPGTNLVLTLDTDSKCTIYDIESAKSKRLAVRPSHNAIAVSPTGTYALLYYAPNKATSTLISGAVNLAEVSIVKIAENLENSLSKSLGLSALPDSIDFRLSDHLLFIVSKTGIERIELDLFEQDNYHTNFALPSLKDPITRTLIDDKGRKGYFIDGASPVLALIDFNAQTDSSIDLSLSPTDLDFLDDDGTLLMTSRHSGDAAIYKPATESLTYRKTDLPIGAAQLSTDGTRIVFYTTYSEENAVYLGSTARILANDFDQTDDIVAVPLIRSIESIFIPEKGDAVLLFHKPPGSFLRTTVEKSVYNNSHALTLLGLSSKITVPIALGEEPDSFAVSPNGDYVYLILGKKKKLITIQLTTFLLDQTDLPEFPLFVGALPDSSGAFVILDHQLGKIAFVSNDNPTRPTYLTGYELNFEEGEVDRNE